METMENIGLAFGLEARPTAVSDAVDWMTITTSDPSSRTSVLKRFLRAKEALLQFGEMPRTWGMRGFKGIQIGGFRWGTRKDCDILIVSGQDAATFWRLFAPLASNCSRLDLAVTVQTEKPQDDLIGTYVSWVTEFGSSHRKRMTEVKRLDGVGNTLYVNRRSSDQMGRLYDKGAQMGLDAYVHRLWRYEVEFKAKRASLVLRQLLGAGDGFPRMIRPTVWEWFNTRDIPPIFDKAVRDGWEIKADLAATVTTTSQKLAWLSSQVRPTVARLKEAGLEREVLDALCLD